MVVTKYKCICACANVVSIVCIKGGIKGTEVFCLLQYRLGKPIALFQMITAKIQKSQLWPPLEKDLLGHTPKTARTLEAVLPCIYRVRLMMSLQNFVVKPKNGLKSKWKRPYKMIQLEL